MDNGKKVIPVVDFLDILDELMRRKDYSVLKDFSDEELAEELCRRTSLGKELE